MSSPDRRRPAGTTGVDVFLRGRICYDGGADFPALETASHMESPYGRAPFWILAAAVLSRLGVLALHPRGEEGRPNLFFALQREFISGLTSGALKA